MRFKKGSKVEVLSQKEVPGGAWRCAVIVSGNGHTYSVSYDWSGKDSQAIVQRVSRKDIRPCPPPVQRVEIWAVGDVAEVFDVGFWKMATVLKVLDENYYLARVLGSFEEFRVHKYRIRARQLWNDDKWVGIGKGPDNRMSLQVPQMNAKIKLPARNNRLRSLYNISCQDSHSVSSGSLKRASPYSSSVEGYSRKMRAIEKGCEHQPIFSGSPSYLLKKVDDVAYPRENLGEKDMHASFINRTTGCVEKEREKLNGVISCFVERSSELNDTDSDACSVGSCSVISSSSNKLFGHNVAGTSQDADTLSSDAESFCCCEDAQENLSLPLKEDVAAGIHRLELNAYRSTLVAMHASGSLSWEQEALLTNLRISLHISNDEHLMEGQGWSLAWLALLPKAKMILGFIILACTVGPSISNFLGV
ncbi:unnamed protein product [Malus baccata var. baccata]